MSTTASIPIRIQPSGPYDDSLLHASLELSSVTLARSRREGLLRFTRHGRRTLYLGKWVLNWLTADAKAKEACSVS